MIRFVTSIKKKYRDRLINREKQWPPCRGEKMVRLELVEMEQIQFLRRDQEDKTVKRTPIVYGDLFKVEGGRKPVRKVLVEGDAGIGKTTLCTAVSEDWANEELFQQFELLLLLPLRHKKVASAGSIPELLKLLHPSQELCTAVASYLEDEEGEKVLIIADGWDELGISERQRGSFIYELLFEELLPFVSVVLTSRPTASAPLHKLPYIDRFVEVRGFNKKNIKEYIQSEFASKRGNADHLLEQLESNPLVESVCSVPLNCAIVCHLWRTLEETLPTTMTELYTMIILNVSFRNMCKISAYEDIRSLSSFDAFPKGLQQSWWHLCEFGFQALAKNQLVFSEEELIEFFPQGLVLDEQILCFGLLQSADSLLEVGRGVCFHFLHLTFQEYLSALHLVKQPPATQLKALQTHGSSELFATVWKFFFGIGFGSVHKIKINHEQAVEGLVQLDPWFGRLHLALDEGNRKLDLCHCAFEAKNEGINTAVTKLMNNFISFDYMTFGTPHTAYDCTAILYVITNTHKSSDIDIKFNDCSVGNKQITALADVLASKHGKLQVKELNLHGNKLTCNCVANLFHRASAAFRSLRKLDLGNNWITTESISSMIPWFGGSGCLTVLDLSYNPGLGVSGMQMLEDAVLAGKLDNLEQLYLAGTLTSDADINGALLTTFTEALSVHCHHLWTLNLSVNNLGIPGAQALGRVMSNLTQNSKIFTLSLYVTMLGDEGVREFIQSLEGTCHLTYLLLSKNGIHFTGVSYLADSKGIFKSIYLSNNQLGLEGVLAVGRMLCSDHCEIIELYLSECQLTTAGGEIPNPDSLNLEENVNLEVNVEQQLCRMPTKKTIEHLNLDGNCFTGETIHILSGFMHLCPNLHRLSTSHCGITSDDLGYLFDHLSKLNLSLPIVKWDLSHNDISDSGVATLIKHLPSVFPLLDKIYDDTNSLLSKLNMVVGIDLRGNKVSSGMMSTLEEELKIYREAKEIEAGRARTTTTPELQYDGSEPGGESDDQSEQDSLTQWDLIISLLYQSAMDYLFCQHSLSLEVVGGVIGDFDISQFAVDYQSSLNVDNEVIDKGEDYFFYGLSFSSNDNFPSTRPPQKQFEYLEEDCQHLFSDPPSPPPPSTCTPPTDTVTSELFEVSQKQIDHHLSLDDLAKVQRAVWEGRSKWYNIGLELIISPGTLDAIKKDNHHVSEDCFTAMLKEWLARSHPPPTWCSLSDALMSPTVGMRELADRLPRHGL